MQLVAKESEKNCSRREDTFRGIAGLHVQQPLRFVGNLQPASLDPAPSNLTLPLRRATDFSGRSDVEEALPFWLLIGALGC